MRSCWSLAGASKSEAEKFRVITIKILKYKLDQIWFLRQQWTVPFVSGSDVKD